MINSLRKKYKHFRHKFKIFFLSNILNKNYIRTGKCKQCGRCCQEIYVSNAKKIIDNEEQFNKIKNLHFFYSNLKVIGKTEFGLVFECTKLDKETRTCTDYRHRSLICRMYPQEEMFIMGGVVTEECGFDFVPLKSFEEVFNSVQNKNKVMKRILPFIYNRRFKEYSEEENPIESL